MARTLRETRRARKGGRATTDPTPGQHGQKENSLRRPAEGACRRNDGRDRLEGDRGADADLKPVIVVDIVDRFRIAVDPGVADLAVEIDAGAERVVGGQDGAIHGEVRIAAAIEIEVR